MLVIIVKAIILITIICNDGKQDQKKKKVKNMESELKNKSHNSENDKKCLAVMLVTFKSQKGHFTSVTKIKWDIL